MRKSLTTEGARLISAAFKTSSLETLTMESSSAGKPPVEIDLHGIFAGFVQDDWRITPRLNYQLGDCDICTLLR